MKTQLPLWLFMTLWLIASVAALLISTIPDARAAEPCMTKQFLLTMLAENFNEYPVWHGIATLGQFKGRKIVRTESVSGKWHLFYEKGEQACLIARGLTSHHSGLRM